MNRSQLVSKSFFADSNVFYILLTFILFFSASEMSYYYPDLHQQQVCRNFSSRKTFSRINSYMNICIQYGTPNPPSMQQNINTNPYPQQQYYSQQPYYPYNSSQQMPFNGPPNIHYPNPSVVDPNALFQFVPPKPKSNHTEVQDIALPIRPNWKPSVEDKQLIEEWFDCISAVQSQADIAKHVGGMEVAVFLKKSNLPKDVLRSIWSLVDKENLGRVNLEQFTIIIRLVSIHCSPIFAGSVPSLDRYYDTVEDVNVRLPFALCEAVAAEQKSKKVDIAIPPNLATESPALAPEPMLTSPAFQPVLPTYPYPSSASTISNQPDEYPASATEDEEFSDFTGAAEVPPAIVQPTVQPSLMPDMLDMDDLSFSVPATKTIELPSYYSGGVFDILDPIRDDEEDFQSFVAAEPTETTTPAPPQGSISGILAEELDEFDNFVSHHAPKESLSVESLERLSERSSLEPTVWLGYHSHSGTSLPSLAEGTASQHSEAVDTLKSDFSGGVMALPTTLNNKMSAFDDLVIAEQEEWDEFAGAAEEGDTGKSNFETFSAPEASSAGPVVRLEEEEDNSLLLLDFESDFIVQPPSMIPALPESSSTDTNLFLGMDWSEPIVDTVNKDATDNDDEFEDFVDCTQANVSTNPHDDSSTICAQTPTLQSRNDEPINITKEDLYFSSALKVEEKIETTEQVSEIFSDDDDFGDFEMHEDNFSEPNGHPIKEAQVPSAVPHLLPTVGAPVSAKSLSDFSPPAAVKSTSIPEKKFSVAPIEVDRQLSSEVINSFSPGTQKLLGRFKQPKNTSTTMNINSSVELSASSNIPPLSMSELEQLSQSLADKNMYEEAYACARQVHLLRRISGLIEQKREALDSNDSDLAQKIKVDTSQLAKKLEPQSQEAVWIQLSKEQRKVGR